MAKAGKKKRSGRPLYQQTADRLGELLAQSAPGQFLPSEPDLAEQFGVSRATLREAMRLYEARGLVVRRRGIGTYVVRPPQVIESGLEVLSSIENLAAQVGVALEAREVWLDERPAQPEEAGLLRIAAGEPIVELSRLIVADGRPVAYFVDCLPREYLDPEQIDDDFTGSVLSLLLKRGDLELDRSRAEITALPVEAEVAAGLGIHPGDVVLYLEAILLTVAGEVVDHSRSYFLPGTFRLHAVRHVRS